METLWHQLKFMLLVVYDSKSKIDSEFKVVNFPNPVKRTYKFKKKRIFLQSNTVNKVNFTKFIS